ncbi:FCP1-like proteiny domain-containing protein [Forsythia ovata]|uniref:FCP1-like proteiny domain-containing protein n=1 Tax=Forsythia ovata TaxID=205694 RepID=A0ABD1T936_9LAMI
MEKSLKLSEKIAERAAGTRDLEKHKRGLDPEVAAVTIHYKVGENLPPVRISSNNNVQCYLNLKVIENYPSRFPLCIDVTMVKNGHSRENVRDIQSTSTYIIMVMPIKLPSLHHIAFDICTFVEEVEEFIHEQQKAIISTPDANEILIEKLFRNKEKLLVLCLGGLLAHRVHNREKLTVHGLKPDVTHGKFRVFKRPFCTEFMKFCFDRFEVGLWSSARE